MSSSIGPTHFRPPRPPSLHVGPCIWSLCSLAFSWWGVPLQGISLQALRKVLKLWGPEHPAHFLRSLWRPGELVPLWESTPLVFALYNDIVLRFLICGPLHYQGSCSVQHFWNNVYGAKKLYPFRPFVNFFLHVVCLWSKANLICKVSPLCKISSIKHVDIYSFIQTSNRWLFPRVQSKREKGTIWKAGSPVLMFMKIHVVPVALNIKSGLRCPERSIT